MAIYVVLLIYIIALQLLVLRFERDRNKANKIVALGGMIAVFIILALKGETVGNDLAGYKQQYLLAKETPWNYWNFVYFEAGYVFIEKLFSKIGVPFQLFMAVIYWIECLAWYKLIEKHSKNAFISVLFFVCYQFFVFSISGVRQALSMSICIFAFMMLEKNRIPAIITGVVLFLIALSVHTGAYAFIAVILMWLLSEHKVGIHLFPSVLTLIFALVIRSRLRWIIELLFNKHFQEDLVFTSGNFAFIVALFLMTLFTIYTINKQNELFHKKTLIVPLESYQERMAYRATFYSIVGMILFSGGTALRSVMYVTTYIPIFLPSIIEKYSPREKALLYLALSLFLVFIFFAYTLLPNQLGLVPYVPFWKTQI